MLGTYRRTLALPGAWQFSASGFVARLPIAMIGLGIVLFISERTGSYAQAGLLAAAFQVSAAGGALLTSRWMDRSGQGRLLPWLALAHAAFLLVFVATVEGGLGLGVQLGAIALAGAFQPAIGSMVRARWAAAAPDTERLRSAFALESIVDEAIFTVGPMLTAFLAFRLGLPAPLVAAAALTVAGSLALAVQRRTEPPRSPVPSGRRTRGPVLSAPGMPLVLVVALGIGGVFGSFEVSVVAFAEQRNAANVTGVLLGLYAFGSLVGGLVFGARHWSMPLARQLVVLTGLLALVLLPGPAVPSVPLLAVCTVVAGLAVAPALIATFSITERLVPAARLTEGLTWTNSGLALGFSVGTALGGVVIDAHGTMWSFCLPILSAGAAFAAAALGYSVLGRASAHPAAGAPAVAWVPDPLPGPEPGGIRDDPDG